MKTPHDFFDALEKAGFFDAIRHVSCRCHEASSAMQAFGEAFGPYSEAIAIDEALSDAATVHEIARCLGVPVEWLDDYLRVNLSPEAA